MGNAVADYAHLPLRRCRPRLVHEAGLLIGGRSGSRRCIPQLVVRRERGASDLLVGRGGNAHSVLGRDVRGPRASIAAGDQSPRVNFTLLGVREGVRPCEAQGTVRSSELLR